MLLQLSVVLKYIRSPVKQACSTCYVCVTETERLLKLYKF